jgi:hypothetical protein
MKQQKIIKVNNILIELNDLDITNLEQIELKL